MVLKNQLGCQDWYRIFVSQLRFRFKPRFTITNGVSLGGAALRDAMGWRGAVGTITHPRFHANMPAHRKETF